MSQATGPSRFVGRAIEQLNPNEWRALHGLWAAIEIYSPATLPLRRIAAVGASVDACIESLSRLNLDARAYEFVPLRSPLPL